jgi:hypothetical protein
LELHPDKTRLMAFGRHAAAHRKQRGEGKPDTFLGGHLKSGNSWTAQNRQFAGRPRLQ